ncbi:MAG TPA: GlsB/YeaQ/YmgE family stress response membrane protein [Planctomycetes bacterium]|nr:GlsB/YeaQ/YmgE family stress response membrane protein [Planctomycetota bacterium]
MGLVWFILIGLIAGWLAGQITRGSGFGLLGNLLVGVVGAVLGGFLLGLIGFAAVGLLAKLVSATLGAVVFLYLLRTFGGRK